LVVIGHDQAGLETSAVLEFTSSLGLPVIVEDPLSYPDAIAHSSIFLADEKVREFLKPDFVIVIGRTTLSRSINTFIASAAKTFVIDDSCSRYQPVRLMFLNSLGIFDYFSFLLVSRLTTNADREQYKKILGTNYQVGNRQNTIVNTNATQQMLVTSNWVDQATSDWLTTELFTSKEVYELQSDGTVLPVILELNSLEDKKLVNDGLFNYEFSYTYSFDYNTQRG
jgi:2-succinyl-5-enolpyruvyl-6-hydroxy-3-cyclohexene-1-carboxylate synthase